MTTHEDNRRILESFPEAKVLHVKRDCILGQHYHKLKEERFILSEGFCLLKTRHIDSEVQVNDVMVIGKIYTVMPFMYHEFEIVEGSVLIGLNSKPFDETDDYKL